MDGILREALLEARVVWLMPIHAGVELRLRLSLGLGLALIWFVFVIQVNPQADSQLVQLDSTDMILSCVCSVCNVMKCRRRLILKISNKEVRASGSIIGMVGADSVTVNECR